MPANIGKIAAIALGMMSLLAMNSSGFSCGSGACAAQPSNIIWSHEMRRLGALPATMVIAGTKARGKFIPSYVELPNSGEAAVPKLFPLRADILPMLEAKAFGREERARLSRGEGGTLRVHCSAGRKPAGAVLSTKGHRFPRRLHGDLVVNGHSNGDIGVSLFDQGSGAPDAPSAGQSLPKDVLALFNLGSWRHENPPEQLVVGCSKKASVSTIRSIEIVPRPEETSPQTGSWIWHVAPWLDRPDELISRAKSHNVNELFLQIRIDRGRVAERARVLSLIERLSSAGISVHAVEGDPHMATLEGRGHALDRAHVLRSFRSAAGGALKTVQYDIEPYLLPQFDGDPARWWGEWARSVNGLAQVLGQRVSVAVPFWMLGQTGGEAALQKVKASISDVVVMAYRTDTSELEEIAGKWLDWGSGQGIMIRIALENGPLPPEYHRTYTLAETGTLLVERSGGTDKILLLDGIERGSPTRVAYSLTRETELNPKRISFMNDQKNLTKIMERLRGNLAAWEAFGGLLVHEIVIP